jgi:hypothetical protein
MNNEIKFDNYVPVSELETRLADHLLLYTIDMSVKTGNDMELYETLKKNEKVASPTIVQTAWNKLREKEKEGEKEGEKEN